MMTRTFATIKLAIENDQLDSMYIELIKQNPEVASEKHGGYTLLNHVCRKLYAQLPTDTLCQSVKYAFSYHNPKAIIELCLTKLKVLRDIATYLLREGARPDESDMLYFRVILSRFTDQTAMSTNSFQYLNIATSTSSFFVNVLNDYKELTNEFIKKGFNYKAPDEYPFNPITSRMKAEELEAYIQTVKDDYTQEICSSTKNTLT